MSAQVFHRGQPAGAELLAAAALLNYGHFSTMQVRDGAVRGFDLHLQRLQQANTALFGSDLPVARVRDALRAALAAFGSGDASLRVTVFAPGFSLRRVDADCEVELLVSLAEPAQADLAPLRLRSGVFAREASQFKHVGTFGAFYQRRLAQQAGSDDALFVDAQGQVAEGPTWNLGLWDGDCLHWPQAPALHGTQQRLLQAGLAALGVPQQVRPLLLPEFGSDAAAFTCNARGQHAVAAVDGRTLRPAADLLAMLEAALHTQPWQAI
ncbi:aminotransferase class IV [Xanthomonas sp. A2111]|uniref:Aminotransferase class IV n=1 Tax=Xanthomonas hawaiiensis TaxID=3003247 RepID=A0ABU2I7Z1_9XANT|nr:MULTISPECIES: aminotransferase class IV [unclassified Xanthomonas]MBO9827656.1 aminotransferase class IV [Xanthomonas sp. A2111]MBO9872319.1 aminotransferase class IV [Xanthomonas sp. D-93]MDS9994254.1 aminotransferase class IV [Xanthomonas sp. A2111]WNH45970.1 aminotransferase class IV [Xanthomonas sp. A6251]